MVITTFFILFLAIAKIVCDDDTIVSHCPKHFAFDRFNRHLLESTWNGTITLESKTTVNGVILDLEFDKPVLQFSNSFGPLTSDGSNTRFRIINAEKNVSRNNPEKVNITAKYDNYFDRVPPNLIKIKFNGKQICPNDEPPVVYNFSGSCNSPLMPDCCKNKRGAMLCFEECNKWVFAFYSAAFTPPKAKTCGSTIITTTGLITWGQDTIPGQWPWQAAIYLVKGKRRNFICGGSLISDKHILTASHCVVRGQDVRPPEDFIVILGKYGLRIFGKYEQTFSLTKVTVHKDFNRTLLYNDIAILHLNTTVNFTDYVRPVCLWSEDTSINNVVNKRGVAVGWGRDHENNPDSDLLMMAYLPVKDPLACIRFYPQFYAFVTLDTNFCAGYTNGTSVCNGDSGGGLFFAKPGTSGPTAEWEIRGLVSNIVPKLDRTCDTDYYAVFTDVAQFLDWIKETIKN